MSTDYYDSITGEIADEGAKTEAAFLEWLDAYTRRPAEGTYHDDLRAAFEAGADRGYAPDVLRRVARLVIGGNAPWLADELTGLAHRLEQEMNGVSTRRAGSDGLGVWSHAWTHFVIGETDGEFAVRAACANEQDAVAAASMSAAEFDQVHVAAIVATPKEAQGSR